MSTTDVTSDLEDLRRQLIAQAELFDSPDYEAGVLDTLDAVVVLLDGNQEDAG